MVRRSLAVAAALAVALSFATPATGDPPPKMRDVTDGILDSPLELHDMLEAQHGPSTGHIPASSENMELIGQITVSDAVEGRISDVWSHGHYAYLGTFTVPDCDSSGVYVIDIKDPTNPQEVGFISQDGFVLGSDNSRPQDLKVTRLNTKAFTGDVLIHSNEQCQLISPAGAGGITLWDVTDPLNPVFLSNIGDFDLAAFIGGANGVHNLFPWQDGNRAYVALVDDLEFDDVDIVEITDPTNPQLIAETGILDWPTVNVDGNGGTVFNHDVWAQRIRGKWHVLSSYWDAGFVLLDVSDPANPVFVDDSDYPFPDPLIQEHLGVNLTSAGNAHAAVWSPSGQFILAGDEDFSPTRGDCEITTGSNSGPTPCGEFAWTLPIAGNFPGDQINGPTVYGGSGCPGLDLDGDGTDDRAQVPTAATALPVVGAGEERILVTTRGSCFFSEKVETGELKGYDAVAIGNHHSGALGGVAPDAFVCGGQGSPVAGTAAGLCLGHRGMHQLFNDPVEFAPITGITSPDMPPAGALGEKLLARAGVFDGMGPLHLLDAQTLEEIDAFAPSEVLDPAFAQGFGDLTMHNVETQGNIAAISWYSLGLRVVRYGNDGLREVGHYIDPGGNNFWGLHFAGGHRNTILASDRDSGLWIFKFTGRRNP